MLECICVSLSVSLSVREIEKQIMDKKIKRRRHKGEKNANGLLGKNCDLENIFKVRDA